MITVEVRLFGGIEGLVGGVFPDGFGFAGDGGSAGTEAVWVCLIGGGVGGVDADTRGGGDGVLVGSEEQEVPLVGFSLVADALGDLLPRVLAGGVFLAVGEYGDDDSAGAIVFRKLGEALAEFVDAAAHGVEQSGHAASGVNRGVDRCDFRQRQGGEWHFVWVIEGRA